MKGTYVALAALWIAVGSMWLAQGFHVPAALGYLAAICWAGMAVAG